MKVISEKTLRFFTNEGKEIIGLDMDSCVANLEASWYALYNRDYQDDLTSDRVFGWDTHLYVKPECGKKIYQYFFEPGIFRTIKPYPHAVDVIRELSERYEFFFVTSTPHTSGYDVEKQSYPAPFSNPYDDKIAWVSEHFPFLPDAGERLISTSQKYLIKASVLIDDGPKNLEKFHDEGNGLAICRDFPYNRNLSQEIPRFRDWRDVPTLLEKLLPSIPELITL